MDHFVNHFQQRCLTKVYKNPGSFGGMVNLLERGSSSDVGRHLTFVDYVTFWCFPARAAKGFEFVSNHTF